MDNFPLKIIALFTLIKKNLLKINAIPFINDYYTLLF